MPSAFRVLSAAVSVRNRRLAVLCLLVLCLCARICPAQGTDPAQQGLEMMASMLPVAPWSFYPDDQVLSDFSGTVLITLRANGSFGLPDDNDGGQTRFGGNVSVTLAYTTVGGHEQTTVSVRGNTVETYSRPAMGQDLPGHFYNPPRRERTVTTYSGPSETTPIRIANLHFSRKLGLSSFQMQIGTLKEGRSQVGHLQFTEERTIDDDEPQRMTLDDQAFFLMPPPGGTANSRWAQLMRSGKAGAMPWAGPFYYEAGSTNGETHGEVSWPVYLRQGMWATRKQLDQMGSDPTAKPERVDEVFLPGAMTVRWSFLTRATPGEMTIAPDDPALYEQWVPVPMPENDDDAPVAPLARPDEGDAIETPYGPARALFVSARVKPTHSGATAPKGRIHFYLRDVSRNPGVCSGFPPERGTEPDLCFADTMPGVIVDPADPLHAYTEQYVSELTVAVIARDTGGWGVVQAVCDDLGLIGRDERTGRHGLVVPLDDNQNCAADTWEHEMGIRDGLADDDDDLDGYTLFEEYRGFMRPDGFVRTDPRVKDN